ncbi:MAG TPA: MFS transporter [Candidatus Dormibacteraeota bacterium]|nr:MFS transporter [Candidatus Dormibacteraeota bacterium]
MLAVTLAVFTNLAMFQALLPVQVAHSGGSKLEVGEATSFFSAATVACEVLTVFLATRIGMAYLLAAGALVIGVATLGYAMASDSIPALLALTAVRGGAFGVDVVTTSYLVAAYAAPSGRGRALGVYGLAVSLPATFGISLGLMIQSTLGPNLAFLLGAIPAVLAGGGFASVIRRSPPPAVTPPRIRFGALPPLLPVAATIVLMTMTYGVLLSFGPALVAADGAAAAPLLFLVFGIARAISRPVAGVLCDRLGSVPVSVASAVLLAAGCFVLVSWTGSAALVTAATLYGVGLGGISNAAYVAMLDRSDASSQALASATWSIAFDGGVAVGSATFAAIAEGVGLAGAAVLLPVVAGVASAVALGDWAFSRPRPTAN